MSSTDFERKLNLLIRAIGIGEVNEQQAKDGLAEVMKYAIHDRERTMARERFDLAVKSRFGVAGENKAST